MYIVQSGVNRLKGIITATQSRELDTSVYKSRPVRLYVNISKDTSGPLFIHTLFFKVSLHKSPLIRTLVCLFARINQKPPN